MKKVCLVSIFVAVLVAFSSPTFAAWYYTHGTDGHIEFQDRFTDTNRYKFGWGLDFHQDSGFHNWVHFAVPTQGNWSKGARYVRLRFYTGSVDAQVTDIHVFNGNTRVFQKPVNYSNGWHIVTIDMGTKKRFYKGLCISVRIIAGVEMMSHRFIFSTAGANFVNM